MHTFSHLTPMSKVLLCTVKNCSFKLKPICRTEDCEKLSTLLALWTVALFNSTALPFAAIKCFPRTMTLMNKRTEKHVCCECCSRLAVWHILLRSHTLNSTLDWYEVLRRTSLISLEHIHNQFQKCYGSEAVFVFFINLVGTFPVFLNLVKLHPEAAVVSKHLNNSNLPYLCHTALCPAKLTLDWSTFWGFLNLFPKSWNWSGSGDRRWSTIWIQLPMVC